MRTSARAVFSGERGSPVARDRLLVLALIVALAAPAAAQSPPTPTSVPAPAIVSRAAFEGAYVPAPGYDNAAAIEAGIDRTAEPFFFAIRGIVRSRLRETNPAFPSVTIAVRDGVIECRTPPMVARDADDGAAGSVVGLDQERGRVTHRVVGDALEQTTWNDRGTRHTRFVPVDDGRAIELRVTVSSSRLSVPLRYVLRYARR